MPVLITGLVISVGLLAYVAATELYSLHLNRLAELKHCPPNCATCTLSQA